VYAQHNQSTAGSVVFTACRIMQPLFEAIAYTTDVYVNYALPLSICSDKPFKS